MEVNSVCRKNNCTDIDKDGKMLYDHDLLIFYSCFFLGNGSWIPPPYAGIFPIYDDTNIQKPQKNVWLFNITADPNEHDDLSNQKPEIVKMMLKKLADYQATAVTCRYPKGDPRADPKRLGGFWGPWE